ncbi:N-acetylmuramoyl-L-alanine amidase [Streptomyces aquilus]|uniref:N-acetylmuramoyl-L-alanine amidase n=1 Tax=Streptomyces aquilus TaxID=2548456 RepID=A0A3Q9BUX0_9ACTN|nr:N-acetylmuramoyl-L-alanine amidase [Streptomyces aquilus]AZP14981.1 N-acetylmuramoyl-L-alanine amidase [Streptomyces aquilus]
MHRRKKALGVPIGIAVSLLVAGSLLSQPGHALADDPSATADSRQQALLAAAEEFDIPSSVLLALSHQESAWEGHGALPSTNGGYGPMNLTDVTPAMLASGAAGAAGRADLGSLAADPALHTLRQAAELTGLSVKSLREDDTANIRGGAALLAAYEKELVGATPADPSQWYGAVARYSQAKQKQAAASFADRVFRTIRSGASATTQDGQRVHLAAGPSVDPARAQINSLRLKAASAAAATECPTTVECTFVAGSPVGRQVADRPANGIRIDTIVIHDLESTYDAGVAGLANPTNPAATHYVMSSTGAVTQMVPTKDIAFHAGNYSTNLHSIGIEHEGYAAHGAAWYTEAQYQATADLVKYLAGRFGIPLDRQHIVGHDNVAGPNSALVSGMHWDPGYAWDWNHFMSLLDAPVSGVSEVPQPGSVVSIKPSFADNVQTLQICPSDDPTGQTTTCTEQQHPTNFVYLHTAPSETAPLFGDQAIHGTAPGTDRVNDWGSTAQAGQQFVVADVQDAWTAIWFSGAKVWFHNPGGVNTRTSYGVKIVKPAGPTPVPLYGSSYPDKAEYPAGLGASTQAPLSMYAIPTGQAYVATREAAATDDYFPSGGAVVIGGKKMYTIQYNHRVALVYANDVTATTAVHHWENDGN